MAPLLDGLLDPDLDLHLMSLSVHDARTHATLTQLSLVRPSTAVPPFSSPFSTTSSSSSSCSPSSSPYLWVPSLRIPWASSLVQLVRQHLNLRLFSPPSESDDFSPCAQRLLNMLYGHGEHTIIDRTSSEWHNAVGLLYTPLPTSLRAHNERTLLTLRKRFAHPRPLERFAVYARLAYLNSLMKALEDTAANLRLRAVRMAKECNDNDYADYDKDEAGKTRKRERNGVNIAEDVVDKDRRVARNSLAEFDDVETGVDEDDNNHDYVDNNYNNNNNTSSGTSSALQSNNNNNQHYQQQQLPQQIETRATSHDSNGFAWKQSVRKRKTSSRPRVIVSARLLPPSPSRHRYNDTKYSSSEADCGSALVHGVVIRGDVLWAVCDTMRARYGVEIVCNDDDSSMLSLYLPQHGGSDCMSGASRMSSPSRTTQWSGTNNNYRMGRKPLSHHHQHYHPYSKDMGSLSSLCNRGTALLRNIPPSPLFQHQQQPQPSASLLSSTSSVPSSASSSSSSSSSSPSSSSFTNVQIDDYLRDAFGTTWRAAISKATTRARRVASERARRHAAAANAVLEDATILRDKLVERAVVLDVAGASLSRISAFAVVRAGLVHEVDDIYAIYLDEAASRMRELSCRDCMHACNLITNEAK